MAPNSRDIKFKVDYIKSNGRWELVREQYKSIKNRYLTQNDHNHPSVVMVQMIRIRMIRNGKKM